MLHIKFALQSTHIIAYVVSDHCSVTCTLHTLFAVLPSRKS